MTASHEHKTGALTATKKYKIPCPYSLSNHLDIQTQSRSHRLSARSPTAPAHVGVKRGLVP